MLSEPDVLVSTQSTHPLCSEPLHKLSMKHMYSREIYPCSPSTYCRPALALPLLPTSIRALIRLVTLLDELALSSTSFQTLLWSSDAACTHVWYLTDNSLDVDTGTKNCLCNVCWHVEERIGKVVGTRIFGIEGADELSVFATDVHHAVDCGLWEDGHLAGGECLLDEWSTVLDNHPGVGCAFDSDSVFGCSRVNVGWKYGARTKVDDGLRTLEYAMWRKRSAHH